MPKCHMIALLRGMYLRIEFESLVLLEGEAVINVA